MRLNSVEVVIIYTQRRGGGWRREDENKENGEDRRRKKQKRKMKTARGKVQAGKSETERDAHNKVDALICFSIWMHPTDQLLD